MLSGISITCFAASYFIAWLLELTRLLFRSGVRGAIMLGFAGAGLAAHSIFLCLRAAESPDRPLSSSFDWCLLAAWMLAASYGYFVWSFPRAAVGLYLWPLVLALVLGAAQFADRTPIAPEPAYRVWGMIHGIALLLGTVTVMVGFVVGLMYLLQAHRLKQRRIFTGGLQLPSLEWLEHVSARIVFLSVAMVGVGFVAGIILNVVGGKVALPWTDPVVWSSGLMLAWLVAAALFNVFYRPARHGRKVAYMTISSFVFLVFALGVFLLVDSRHGAPRAAQRPPATPLASAAGSRWDEAAREAPSSTRRAMSLALREARS